MSYESVKKNFDSARKKLKSASDKFNTLCKELDDERRKLSITCASCKFDIPIAKMVLIKEWDRYCHEDHETYKLYTVCPSCTDILKADYNTEPFPDGLEKFVKSIVHSASTEAKTLMLPANQRRQAEQNAINYQRKLQEARELLESAGELYKKSL